MAGRAARREEETVDTDGGQVARPAPDGAPAEDDPPERTVRVGLADLDWLRGLVTRLGRRAGLDAERVARLTLAVNEVVSNAIRYARGYAEVRLARDDRRVAVDVRDDGPGLPPGTLPPRRPDPQSVHGRGLWLVHVLCDDVQIRSGRGGTAVLLIMRVRPSTAATS